jgi:hypothetical protein
MEPAFSEVLVSLGRRQMAVRTDLPYDSLVKLLANTRAKRPTLVWAIPLRDECFMSFLNQIFDPGILTNPRTVCANAAIRYARQSAKLHPDKVQIVLPQMLH